MRPIARNGIHAIPALARAHAPRRSRGRAFVFLLLPVLLPFAVVGGDEPKATGNRVPVPQASDDFENPDWSFDANQSGRGKSFDGRWNGSRRGVPGIVDTVPTPGKADRRSLRLQFVDEDGEDATPQADLIDRSSSAVGSAGRLPFVESLVRTPSPAALAESPVAVTAVGLRLSVASDDRSQAYYPSLILRQSAGSTTLFARLGDGYVQDVPVADFPVGGGPIRLGIGFDDEGIARYYARAGTESLREKDLVWDSTRFETSHPSGRNPRLDRVKYHFLSLSAVPAGEASPPFLFDHVRFHAVP